MRIEELALESFGPFRQYVLPFPPEDHLSVLLTGRNNEGKSSLIQALRLLDAGCKVVNQRRQEMRIAGDAYYRLRHADVGHLNIARLVHNYEDRRAVIIARFSNRFRLMVYVDPLENDVYADYRGRIPSDVQSIFGFVPPLGQLAEVEEPLTERHVRDNVSTTLSPRHFRNQLRWLLSDQERELFRVLVRDTWPGVELGPVEFDAETNRLNCFFKEGRYEREVAWAGQGLQVWLQILLHMVAPRCFKWATG